MDSGKGKGVKRRKHSPSDLPLSTPQPDSQTPSSSRGHEKSLTPRRINRLLEALEFIDEEDNFSDDSHEQETESDGDDNVRMGYDEPSTSHVTQSSPNLISPLSSPPASPDQQSSPKPSTSTGFHGRGYRPSSSRGRSSRVRRRGRGRGIRGRGRGSSATSPSPSPPPTSPSQHQRFSDNWTDTNFNPTILQFTGKPGVNVGIPTTLVGFLQLFLTRELLDFLVRETNRYAMESTNVDERYMWIDLTIVDMANFLGLVIYMGISRLPEMSMYWQTGIFGIPIFPQTMTFRRFQQIQRFFHASDNSTIPIDCTDRIIRVRPMMSYLQRLFKIVYTPDKHLSLDEGGMPWKGRLAFKVYEPHKPNKYMVKFYILAEAGSGYVTSFDIYANVYSSTSNTVKKLMSHLQGQGYRLYMDNYYNSVALSEDLLRLGTHTCGTLRIVRGAPVEMKQLAKAGKMTGSVFRQKGDTGIILWRDKKLVAVVSNMHNGDTEHITRHGKYKVRGQVRYFQKDIQKPKSVIEYNKYMGGVDHFDQMIQYYKFTRRTSKWTKKMTFYFLQMAIYNAFVLYSKHSPPSRKTNNLRHFHSKVVELLTVDFNVEHWPYSGHAVIPDASPPSPPPPPPSPTPAPAPAPPAADLARRRLFDAAPVAPEAGPVAPTRRARALALHDPDVRLNKDFTHSLIKIAGGKRRVCRVCSKKKKRSDCHWECGVCEMALCIDPCFKAYHTLVKYW